MIDADEAFLNQSHEEAISKWINVTVRRITSLQGGVSGAQVNLVKAAISFPAQEHKFDTRLIDVVVKFSAKEDFQLERANFADLPKNRKKLFVDFTAPGNEALVKDHYFMIMPHLERYKTLAHYVHHEKGSKAEKAIKLTKKKLRHFHFLGFKSKPADKSLLGKFLCIYLSDIEDSNEKISSPENPMYDLCKGLGAKRLSVNGRSLLSCSEYIEKLMETSKQVSPSFVTWSHGDCHSRNIMIELSKPDLKFIDIDAILQRGDYICDMGTLIADLQVYHVLLNSRRPDFRFEKVSEDEFSYELKRNDSAIEAAESLKEYTAEVAAEFSDGTFERRLLLSKARYLLHMASKTTDVEKALVAWCEGLIALDDLENL